MRFGNDFAGGNDDYPPSPTTIPSITNNNHNSASSPKKLKHLTTLAGLAFTLSLLVLDLPSNCLILVGLYLLFIFLEPKFFAAAGLKDIRVEPDNNDADNDAQFEVLTHDTDYPLASGSISTAGNGDGGRYELCGTDLCFLGPPYGNISTSNMFCSPIWNTFVLRTTGWVGIGFSRNGMMLGSSAMVGWFNRKGQARIKQYYLQGEYESQVIPDKGELPLNNIPPVVALHGAMIYLAF
ncbi:hypothetical protein CRYUN_Cryun20dG0036500 [Craigia yunnanensis]